MQHGVKRICNRLISFFVLTSFAIVWTKSVARLSHQQHLIKHDSGDYMSDLYSCKIIKFLKDILLL